MTRIHNIVLVLAVLIFAVVVFAKPMDCTDVEITPAADTIVDAVAEQAGIVAQETDAVCIPDPPRPDDLDWCVTAASESQNVREDVLYAVYEIESGSEHYNADGTVKRGDWSDKYQMWMARGGWQIHYSPWQQWASDELGYEVDLDVLEDNVLVCAMILRYYLDEYDGDLTRALGHYNGGPYNSKGYARKVKALLDTEDDCETESS